MIHQEICFVGTCDNCGEIFNDGEYSMFPLESDVKDQMINSSQWYADDTDKDHIGKHYCPDCYELDTDIDDKINIDLSKFKPVESSTPVKVEEGWINISIDNLLPLSPYKCWVCVNGTYVTEGYYDKGKWHKCNDDDNIELLHVTHYMQYTQPAPPKQ